MSPIRCDIPGRRARAADEASPLPRWHLPSRFVQSISHRAFLTEEDPGPPACPKSYKHPKPRGLPRRGHHPQWVTPRSHAQRGLEREASPGLALEPSVSEHLPRAAPRPRALLARLREEPLLGPAASHRGLGGARARQPRHHRRRKCVDKLVLKKKIKQKNPTAGWIWPQTRHRSAGRFSRTVVCFLRREHAHRVHPSGSGIASFISTFSHLFERQKRSERAVRTYF